MELFGIDLDKDVAVIAEIGVNHEGNVDVAADLVRAAAKAGAHAVKFQSYTPSRFVGASDPERLARVEKFGLDADAHRHLADVARQSGIAFFSSAITEDWVPLIAELGAAVKIASGDLTFEPVIRAAAASGLPVVLSTGAGDEAEVEQAIAWFTEDCDAAPEDRLVLLHCISEYPTSIENANLLSIPFLADRFGLTVGWSNHVLGPEACIGAVALGARVIEVHVTDRKTGREFRDHELSFEPAELASLVAAVGRMNAARGTRGKFPNPGELEIREAIRKGVTAAKDLAAGHILGADDLMYSRPATGIPSGQIGQIVGLTLSRPISSGSPIQPADVEGLGAV